MWVPFWGGGVGKQLVVVKQMFNCPYFRGEFKVLVSRRRVHPLLKLFKPVVYLICLLFAFENHQAVISIDAMVDVWAENRLSIFKEVKKRPGLTRMLTHIRQSLKLFPLPLLHATHSTPRRRK